MTIEQLTASLADRYRIESQLGQGGMATVYLAEDLRHHRQVALKVLKPELAAVIGAERFLQEIRLTANLQHPHILPLFDSGEVQGTVFYIMPFIQGESLRDQLTREKQLPVSDAIRIATQVAQALDYAHRHGVIHRDIKPENILLHDQSALVADFGIALAASKAGGSRMTETGMSLGTPHYMSPEQAMGERDLDARSDIYALGATLYEMLTGEPPFTGPTAQAIVARVLSENPRPVTGLRPTVPTHVDTAIRTALQKLPADRFATAASFAAALAKPDGTTAYPAPASPRGSLARWAPWLVAAAAVAVAVVAAIRDGRAPTGQPPSRLAVLAPGLGGSGGTALARQVALSPDGGTVIFATVDQDGITRLVRQTLDAETPVVLPLEGGTTQSLGNPVVSPDGRWLLASTVLSAHLYRFPLEGGTGRRIAPGRQVYSRLNGNFAFTQEGDVWATGLGSTTEIARIDAGDTVVQELGPYQSSVRVGQVLPDGSILVATRAMGSSTGPVSILNAETGAETSVLSTPLIEARYTAGYLVFALGSGDLQAVPFDLRRHAVTGTPVTIATGVSLTGTGIAQFAVAANGTVAYIPEEPRSLVFVDRAGTVREATRERRNFHAPLFSPDGRRLSTDFTTADGRDVWLLSIGSGTLTRTTFDRDGHDATWTPDGRFLTYASGKSGVLGLYRTRPGSAEPAESLFSTPELGWTGQWLADGTALVTVGNAMRGNSQSDVGIIRNAGHGPMEPLVASTFNEQYPNFSHDQRWLAFASDQSGQLEVYVRPLDRDGDVVQVSQHGGSEPVWARNGRDLFYRGFTAEGHPMLFVATVGPGPGFTVASREALFSLADFVGTQPHANYDISPDGHTFVMVRRSPSTRIMIIQNLPALVEHLRGEGR